LIIGLIIWILIAVIALTMWRERRRYDMKTKIIDGCIIAALVVTLLPYVPYVIVRDTWDRWRQRHPRWIKTWKPPRKTHPLDSTW